MKSALATPTSVLVCRMPISSVDRFALSIEDPLGYSNRGTSTEMALNQRSPLLDAAEGVICGLIHVAPRLTHAVRTHSLSIARFSVAYMTCMVGVPP